MRRANVQIRQFRKARGQTQSELGRLIGVPQSTISRWEKGINLPGAEHAAKLAELMDLPVYDLLGFDENPQSDYTAQPSAVPDAREAGVRPGAEKVEERAARHPAFGIWKGKVKLLEGFDYTRPADPDWGKVYDD
jgi:transcriptional regulator with XRE-family HTH domain